MTEIRIRTQVDAVERLGCMDEKDVECPHCHGLTAHAFCEDTDMIHCVHCGNMMDVNTCVKHRVNKKAEVPRHA